MFVSETVSEYLVEKESKTAEKVHLILDEKSELPDKGNSTLSTSSNTNSSPPWAANQVKKSSFRSVSFVTPTVRPPRKEPVSAPPVLNKFTSPKQPPQLVVDSDLNESDPSEKVGPDPTNSRFGKREFSASFKTYRPTYKPPEHFKTRAESFRLHRPKDFIKQTTNEESPVLVPTPERVILNPVSPLGNQTPTPFTSTPQRQQPFSQSLNTPAEKPKPSSSLQRSESCKENQQKYPEAQPFIPIVRGNKRRSRGILSKILSSKIDSEKANLELSNSRAEPKPATAKFESFESPISPVSVQLHSVAEEKVSKPKETNPKLPLTSPSEEQRSAKLTLEQNLPKYKNLDETSESPVKEIEKQISEVKKNESQLQTAVLLDTTEETLNLSTQPLGFEESLSSYITILLTNVIDQVLATFKQDKSWTQDIKNSTSTKEVLSDQISPKNLREVSVTSSSFIETDGVDFIESVKLESKVGIQQTGQVVVVNSVETAEYVTEVDSNVSNPLEKFSVSSLEDLPETSLLDDFQPSDSLSLSSDSGESFIEDDNKMEGKYSLRSRRNESGGSVRSRIQATENRNGIENKSVDGKRTRQGVDVRAFRNAEGVKSRMNKFAAMMTSPTSPTKSFSPKTESPKHPDANNNINGGLTSPKDKAGIKLEPKKESKVITEKQEDRIPSAATNGYAEESLTLKTEDAVAKDLPVSPLKEKAELKSASGPKIVELEPIVAQQASVQCAPKQAQFESLAPLVNGVNSRHTPLDDDKVNTINSLALEKEIHNKVEAASRQVLPQVGFVILFAKGHMYE